MDTAIKKILARTDTVSLPAIPRVLLDLIEAFQDGNIGFDELAGIIGHDAGLSSKVLAAVNSSFYRRWKQLTDLNRALVVLGLNTLKTITITTAVRQFFHQIPPSQHHFLDAVWHKSLVCAHIARRLAVLTSYDSPDLAYLTGLLHRLGQLILLQCFGKDYSVLLSEDAEDFVHGMEKKTFGAAYNEVGAYLIDTWHTQTFMADAVLYQLQPAESILDSPPIVKLVNVAAKLCNITAQNEQTLFEQAYLLFGLNQAMVEDMLADMKVQVDALAGSLGLSTVGPEEPGDSDSVKKWLQNRHDTQQRLAEHVQNISLIGAIGHAKDIPLQASETVAAIQRDFAILFGYRKTAVYLHDPHNNSLAAYRSDFDRNDNDLWSSLTIALKKHRSLAANALLANRILNSYDDPLPAPIPVVDLQMCRLLNTEGLLAVPLMANDRRLGVIVAGIGAADNKNIQTKRRLIALFASEAAAALQAQESVTRNIRDGIDATRSEFELHAKKISHEANNPLSIINNYLYLLGHKLGEQSPEEIGLIRDEIKRVGDLVLRLSDTRESAGTEPQIVDINTVIQDLIMLFQSGVLSVRQISTKLDLDDKLPPISTSRTKLKQVLTNLIKNAAEAASDGGTITITTRDRVYLGNDCCIEISVSDDGPGLPDDIKNRLFTPVASTKGAEHSGLGLTIVKSLVDELDGTITCRSRPNEGTVFRIFLPRRITS
ncbi:MAG: HDOD domain-containing protein [Gammaproteobacteria bacterium]